MIKRLAVVLWWVGVLLAVLAILLTVVWGADAGVMLTLAGVAYLGGCVVCFILSGSFWHPPKM